MRTTTDKKGKLLILIVDDNLFFVEKMIGLIKDLTSFIYVSVATNYDEAFRAVKEEMPDLVLLDINLPGKNGIELLKKIKKESEDCKVIMITNHADEYYRQQCSELGADQFLDKSHDFGKVPSIIRQLNSEFDLYSPGTCV